MGFAFFLSLLRDRQRFTVRRVRSRGRERLPIISMETLCILFVKPGGLPAAIEFYQSAFGAHLIGSVGRPTPPDALGPNSVRAMLANPNLLPTDVSSVSAELRISRTSVLVYEWIANAPDPSRALPACIEVQTDNVANALATTLQFGSREIPISGAETQRGIKAKVLDPFGFVWGFSESPPPDIDECVMCNCDPHLSPFCVDPLTHRWILQSRNKHLITCEQEFLYVQLEELSFKLRSIHLHYNTQPGYSTQPYSHFRSLMHFIGILSRFFAVLRWVQLLFCMEPELKPKVIEMYENVVGNLSQVILETSNARSYFRDPSVSFRVASKDITKLLEKLISLMGRGESADERAMRVAVNVEYMFWKSKC